MDQRLASGYRFIGLVVIAIVLQTISVGFFTVPQTMAASAIEIDAQYSTPIPELEGIGLSTEPHADFDTFNGEFEQALQVSGKQPLLVASASAQESLNGNFGKLLSQKLSDTMIPDTAVATIATNEGSTLKTSGLVTKQPEAVNRLLTDKHSPSIDPSIAKGKVSVKIWPRNKVQADAEKLLSIQESLQKLKQAHKDKAASFVRQQLTKKATKPAIAKAPAQVETAQRLPTITGFLKPQGFSRPVWQRLSNKPILTPATSDSQKFIVMIDPGHGGSDPGSVAHNGLQEKELTLDIAKRIRLFLSEFEHLEVLLTRDHDHGLTRQSRVNMIKHSDADMVISLHFNHLPQSELNVVESFYAGPRNVAESRADQARRAKNASNGKFQHTLGSGGVDISFTQGSQRLAKTLHQRIFAEVSFDNESVHNAGVKPKTFYVLTQSYKPGALIEMTCLSNPREAMKLMTDQYKNRLAAALADGIRNYHESLRISPLNRGTDIGV